MPCSNFCTCKTGAMLHTHPHIHWVVLQCGINSNYLSRGESLQLICPVFSVNNIHYCRNITLIFKTRFFFPPQIKLNTQRRYNHAFLLRININPCCFWHTTNSSSYLSLVYRKLYLKPDSHISEIYAKSLLNHFPHLLYLTHATEPFLPHRTKHCFSQAV